MSRHYCDALPLCGSSLAVEHHAAKGSYVGCVLAAYMLVIPLDTVNGLDALIVALPLVGGVVAILLGRGMRITVSHLSIMAFAVFVASSSLWSLDPATSISRSVPAIALCLVYLLTTVFLYRPHDADLAKTALIASGLGLTIYLLLYGSVVDGRLRIAAKMSNADPNTVCGFLILPILCSLERTLHNGRSAAPRLQYAALATLMLWAYLLTVSRGGLVALVVGIAALIVSTKGTPRPRTFILAVAGLAVAVVLGAARTRGPMLGRVTLESVINDGASGRFRIWMSAVNAIVADAGPFLLGHGTGTTVQVMGTHGKAATVTHNLILQVWLDYGLVGLLLFGVFVLSLLLRCARRRDALAMSGVMALLAYSMSLDTLTYKSVWSGFVLASLLSATPPPRCGLTDRGKDRQADY